MVDGVVQPSRPVSVAEWVFHSRRCHFGLVVLGSPPGTLQHRIHDYPGVRLQVGLGVGPHELWLPVRRRDRGGEPFDLGCDDPGGEEGFPDERRPGPLCVPSASSRTAAGIRGPGGRRHPGSPDHEQVRSNGPLIVRGRRHGLR